MVESVQYGDNCFLTLTYDDEHVPKDGSLVPRDLQLFIKRLRKHIEPRKVRYFGVGEYGDTSERPHYHVALFGIQSCLRGYTSPRRDGSCCEVCDSMRKLWQLGNVFLGTLTEQSAHYVAGYVTKKLTNADDVRLHGRRPEFARMSLRPGIGAGFMDEVASVLMEHNLDVTQEDVPQTLQHGRRKWPLGRYLRQQLRIRVGLPKNNPKALQKYQEELYPLQVAAKRSTEFPSLKQHIIRANTGGRIKLESKAFRNRKRGTL